MGWGRDSAIVGCEYIFGKKMSTKYYDWSKFWAITRPNKAEFIAALPRNATGKVLKRRLKDM